MRTAYIDGGKHMCAVAVALNGRIESVHYCAPQDYTGPQCQSVLAEKPMIYRGGKADPDDLIEVAIGLGYMIGMLRPVVVRKILPRQWKGTVNKTVFTERIRARLSPKEIELMSIIGLPKKTEHNVLDAIGLLMHDTGRL